MRIACLGECMIELSGSPLERRFGGDTLNTALYLARLLSSEPEPVAYISALGDDPLSRDMLARWREEGLDTERVAVRPGELPGLYLVELDPDGERRFFYWRDNSAARRHFATVEDFTPWLDRRRTDALYLSGISLALFPGQRREAFLDALEGFRAEGGQLWYDNNFRPALWHAAEARAAQERMLAMTDIALLTLDDECQLHGPRDAASIARDALSRGCGEVVVKRGAEPCLLAGPDHWFEVPAQSVPRVVDTCAAGDAFAAAYLASRIQGLDERQAAENGHRLAATVIGHFGAIIPRGSMPGIDPGDPAPVR